MTFAGSRHWVSGHSTLVDEWDWDKNNDVRPDEVSSGSARRLWWRCDRGPDHRWRASANNRTHGTGCPFCANRAASVTNSLASRAPEIAREWHPALNGRTAPDAIVVTSTRVAWWSCPHDAAHAWRARVRDRVRDNTGCPYCAKRRVLEDTSLAHEFPSIAAEWNAERNDGLEATDVSSGSSRRVWWRCASGHEWRATVSNRTLRASGCPECARKLRARTGRGT